MKNTIYPCLWFNGNAKEAAEFYCSVYSNSKITSENPVVVTWNSHGQNFMFLNGGPMFTINPSISFFVVCENAREIDQLWERLIEGGKTLMPKDKYEWSEKYGWLQDKYGVNWQLSLGKMEDVGQKFTPTLMFTGDQAGRAEKAINFYTSVFKDSSVIGILKYPPQENEIEGSVKHAQFKLGTYVIMAMDSSFAHDFGFNEAVSLVVPCNSQEEIDYYWSNLTVGGEESMCGWLKDQFGVSWQIVPDNLGQLMSNPEKSKKVMNEIMKMKKLNIEKLVNA